MKLFCRSLPAKKPKNINQASKHQNNLFSKKKNQSDDLIEAWVVKGKVAQINIADTIAITPPNLLGIALNIA